MDKVWNIRNKDIDDNKVREFQKRLNGYLDFQLTKMLYCRITWAHDMEAKVNAARDFLFPNLSMLHDPFLYNDMDLAMDRLCRAVDGGERIMVYGDYDVDGTTSVALVYSFLSEYYSDNGLYAGLLSYYVPDRYTEGYGVSYKGVDEANRLGCSLIIALDCGIKDNPRIDYAHENYGIDFIVCDHHTPGDELPKAVAVLDAKRADNTYPFNELSGCGVGFKLMQAFCIRRDIDIRKLFNYIDLVAVSIGSDIVPIVGENRVLAYHGMLKLNSRAIEYLTDKDGGFIWWDNLSLDERKMYKKLYDVVSVKTRPLHCFKAIMMEAGLVDEESSKLVTITDSVFVIGPRINAAGRMHSGIEAVRLMITDSYDDAFVFAKKISEYNKERKGEDSNITKSALETLSEDPLNDSKCSTVVCGEGWHKGVVGIVASRLTETYYRPTIVLTQKDDMLTGSARSVSDFDLYAAIDSCRDLLTAFGGHKFAAGLSLKYDNIDEFKARFEKYVSEHVTESQKRPTIDIEQYISFSNILEVTKDSMGEEHDFYFRQNKLEPFGPENELPLFATRNVRALPGTKLVGKDNPKTHLRFEVIDDSGTVMTGIGFGMAGFYDKIRDGKTEFDICYTVTENEFMGKKNLQIMVKDVRIKS